MPKERHDPAHAFCASHRWTASLLGEGFFSHCENPTRAAEAYLRRGTSRGLFATAIVDACPIPEVSQPLYSGPPHREPDDYEALAYAAERRRFVCAIPQRIYWPTSRFAKTFGSWTGEDRLTRPELVTHDLLISAVWLIYLRRFPEIALHHWKSERLLQHEHRRGKRLRSIPDALIVTSRRTTAVEIAGRYSAPYIRHKLHVYSNLKWHVVLF